MRADIDHFVVMTPTGDVDDKASVHVYLALTDRLLSSLRLTEPGKLTVRMRAGITHIRGLIVENALTPGEAYNFTFTIDNPPPMGELKRKECTYQEHARVGLRCLAAHPRDRAAGVTTTEICEGCQLPSTDLLCDAVTHPVVVGNDEAARLTARNLVESKCDVGSREFDGAASCVPHIRSCWHKTIPLKPYVAPAQAPAGAFRTVLFTDIAGSTEMMQRLGDERGRDVLREHERITREVLKAHGGTEVKTMGDGFMASFGSVTKAVECAVALQRAFEERNEDVGAQHAAPLQVRIGLNAGEPIEEEGDLFGATVILAARIAAEANGGEILVADTVRGLCSGKGFLFADRGEFAAKGFEEPVRLYEVSWRA